MDVLESCQFLVHIRILKKKVLTQAKEWLVMDELISEWRQTHRKQKFPSLFLCRYHQKVWLSFRVGLLTSNNPTMRNLLQALKYFRFSYFQVQSNWQPRFAIIADEARSPEINIKLGKIFGDLFINQGILINLKNSLKPILHIIKFISSTCFKVSW